MAQKKPHQITVTITTTSNSPEGEFENQQHLLTEGAFTAEELVRKHFAIDAAVSKAVRDAMIELAAGADGSPGFDSAKELKSKGNSGR